MRDRFGRFIQTSAEIALSGERSLHQRFDGPLDRHPVVAIGNHAGPAMVNIGERETRHELGRKNLLRCQRFSECNQTTHRLAQGALPRHGNQKGELPIALVQHSAAKQPVEQHLSTLPGLRHIDMRIAAVR